MPKEVFVGLLIVVAVVVGLSFFVAKGIEGRDGRLFSAAQACINDGGQYVTTPGRHGTSRCLFQAHR